MQRRNGKLRVIHMITQLRSNWDGLTGRISGEMCALDIWGTAQTAGIFSRDPGGHRPMLGGYLLMLGRSGNMKAPDESYLWRRRQN
jgi:hypothetical protein